MAQLTRPCVTCGITLHRTKPTGPIRGWCSPPCRPRGRVVIAAVPCRGCGGPSPRLGNTGPVPVYGSDACKPRCSIDGCTEPMRVRTFCSHHYDRWSQTGDPLTPVTRFRNNGRLCEIPGCPRARRKRQWCQNHYMAWYKHGDPQASRYRWSDRSEQCVLCDRPTAPGLRLHCSQACWTAHARARRQGQLLPAAAVRCRVCGGAIPTYRRGGRTVQRSDILACKPCRQQEQKHGVSVRAMVKMHGALCRLCGVAIDVRLKAPHPMAPSIDHIRPRARGGTNARRNLQLAHLRCNISKGARIVVARAVKIT